MALDVYYWNSEPGRPWHHRKKLRVFANGVEITDLISGVDVASLFVHTNPVHEGNITITFPTKYVRYHADREPDE